MIDNRRFENRASLIDIAAGRTPGDTLLKNCRIVNVFTGQVQSGSVLIGDGKIAALLSDRDRSYRAKEEIDLDGAFLLPGLIDSHVHIESSLLTPANFASLVLPRGTTTVIADPHEIANVAGEEGVRFMIADAARSPLHCYFMVPSCVPATSFENSGAILDAAAVAGLLDEPGVLGLGEVMDFPGVIQAEPALLEKIAAAGSRGMPVDGHGPMLVGSELMAYIASGIQTDHECSTEEEARERLERGMRVLIREGSAARNLDALLPAVNDGNSRRISFCTDDKLPGDIIAGGHINHILRRAVQRGLAPVTAVQMATINAAEAYGLEGKGGIAPGWDADLVAVNNLRDFDVLATWSEGIRVAAEGKSDFTPLPRNIPAIDNSVRVKKLVERDFALTLSGDYVNVIHVHPGSLITEKAVRRVHIDNDGQYIHDRKLDLAKLTVVERHHMTGNIGLGLVEGYGLKSGAIATTIAHDSHNLLIIGRDDRDMLRAAEELISCGGGICLVKHGEVLDTLALPVGGLMSDDLPDQVSARLGRLQDTARNELGTAPGVDAFMTLSFLALPVIPEIKLTDRGLFDVTAFAPMDINA